MNVVLQFQHTEFSHLTHMKRGSQANGKMKLFYFCHSCWMESLEKEENIIMDVTACNLRRLMHSLKIHFEGRRRKKFYLRAITSKFNFKRFKDFSFLTTLLHFPHLPNELFLCFRKLTISLGPSAECNLIYHLFCAVLFAASTFRFITCVAKFSH